MFTGDWIPDHELARLADLDLDPGTRPAVDTALATSAARAGRPASPPVPVTVDAPLTWISPSVIADPRVAPPRGRFILRTAAFAAGAHLEVTQDGRVLARARTRLTPARSISLSASWRPQVNPCGGPVRALAR